MVVVGVVGVVVVVKKRRPVRVETGRRARNAGERVWLAGAAIAAGASSDLQGFS